MDGSKGAEKSVLCERVVLLCTSNYGLLAMAYILINETIPLFLKLDTRLGGFSLDSSHIGTLLSLSGFTMLAFTYFLLPIFASQNPLWLFKIGTIFAIPFSFGWPIVAILNETVLTSLPSLSHYIIMWTLLGEDEYHSTTATYSNSVLYVTQSSLLFVVVVAVGQNIGGCLSFTAVMILINHSVVADDLGKVNGLGQSMASLTRAIGPAIGIWICMAGYFVFVCYINYAYIHTLHIFSITHVLYVG